MTDRQPYIVEDSLQKFYADFRQSNEFHSIGDFMRAQLAFFRGGEPYDQGIEFLDNDHHMGCILKVNRFQYTEAQAHALALHWKDSALAIGYISYMSDQYGVSAPGYSKVFRHYLKPPTLRSTEFPVNMLFGNIEIRVFHKEHVPMQVRIDAKAYPGPQYQHNDSIEEFIHLLV